MKFRRQHPIGDFIVDFYCHEHRLAIELDGESHADRGESDRIRQEEIERLGVRMVRYGNDDVLQDIDTVLDQILRESGVELNKP